MRYSGIECLKMFVCDNKYKMLQQLLGRCGIFMGAVHMYRVMPDIYIKKWFNTWFLEVMSKPCK